MKNRLRGAKCVRRTQPRRRQEAAYDNKEEVVKLSASNIGIIAKAGSVMPQDEPKFTCAVCQFVFSSDDIWIAEMKIAICIGCWERNVPENRLPFPKGLRRDLTAVLNGLQGYDAFFKEAA